MNSSEYKKICREPAVFNVGALEAILGLLREKSPVHAKLVAQALLVGTIPKPTRYSGERQMQYCRIDCSQEEASGILQLLVCAEAGAVSPAGDTTNEASFWASIVDVWGRFVESLEGRREL